MKKAVIGIVETQVQAEIIVQKLQAAGFGMNEISVLLPDIAGSQTVAHEKHTKAPEGATAGGLQISRGQVELDHPIKTLGVRQVRVVLHPEVTMNVAVNVARSPEEAEKQLRGEAVGRAAEEEGPSAADIFGTEEEAPEAA